MSGPKISELQAIRAKLLRDIARSIKDLERIISKWESELIRQGIQLTNELKVAQESLDEIKKLKNRNKLDEALNKCNSFKNFYHRELNELQEKWIKAKQVEVKRERRVQSLSAYLVDELKKIGRQPANILIEAAKGSLTHSSSSCKLEEAISKAIVEIEEHDNRQLNEASDSRIKEYAELFKDRDDGKRFLTDWLKTKEMTGKLSDLNTKLDNIFASLKIWCPNDSLIKFKEKANVIHSTLESGRCHMLLNSLILEISELKNKIEDEKEVKESLETASANLDIFTGKDADRWRININKALNNFNIDAAKKLKQKFEVWQKAEEKIRDAEARRNAVLSALDQLGYEVNEGMHSALISDGKVVLQKPMKKNYGLEVIVPREGETLLTRVVAFRSKSTAVDKSRDKEIEEEWCSEYAQFLSTLNEAGIEHNFKKTHQPGEVKMKIIQKESDKPRDRESDMPHAKEQSI